MRDRRGVRAVQALSKVYPPLPADWFPALNDWRLIELPPMKDCKVLGENRLRNTRDHSKNVQRAVRDWETHSWTLWRAGELESWRAAELKKFVLGPGIEPGTFSELHRIFGQLAMWSGRHTTRPPERLLEINCHACCWCWRPEVVLTGIK